MGFQEVEEVQVVSTLRKAGLDDRFEKPVENLRVIEEGIPRVEVGKRRRKRGAGKGEGKVCRKPLEGREQKTKRYIPSGSGTGIVNKQTKDEGIYGESGCLWRAAGTKGWSAS
jgi:hypothetical protein